MAARASKARTGPKALTGSADAKLKVAVMLEALSGLRTTQSAADELSVALPRYYMLETRMLQAMVSSLEPRSRGRQRTKEAALKAQVEENKQLRREVLRLQTLYRASQRAMGVKEARPPKTGKGKTTKARRMRKQARGERVLRALRGESERVACTMGPPESQGD